jgi:hypothetical protein
MVITVVPSGRGERVAAIRPAQDGSGDDQRGQKRDPGHDNPREDAGTSEPAPTTIINGHVDKLV